jgi:hypothetical protein
MIFDGTDLETASLNEVKEIELAHIANQLFSLAQTKRLCSITGKEVLAEFRFKGNFDEVVQQLNLMSALTEDCAMTEEGRTLIIKRKKRLLAHMESCDSDVQTTAMLEAVRSNDPMLVIDLASQKHMLNDILHEQGMCECFTN